MNRSQIKYCEQELYGNVPINFLFQRGDPLNDELIDPKRLNFVVAKIKNLARMKAKQQTPKEIDYNELVWQIKHNDHLDDEVQKSKEMKPETEPQVIPFSVSGGSDWT